MYAEYSVWVRLGAPQCTSLWKWQLVSWAVCVWSGPLVCGQKTEKLLSGAITALTVSQSHSGKHGTVREMFAEGYKACLYELTSIVIPKAASYLYVILLFCLELYGWYLLN